jgi:hypothetical protein
MSMPLKNESEDGVSDECGKENVVALFKESRGREPLGCSDDVVRVAPSIKGSCDERLKAG